MRKFTTFSKLALGVTLLAGAALGANAAEIGGDLTQSKGVAQPGNQYNITLGQYYTYTPTTNDPISIKITSTLGVTNFGWQMGPEMSTYFFFGYAEPNVYYPQSSANVPTLEDGGYTFLFNVTANKEYLIAYGNDLAGEGLKTTGTLTFEILSDEVVLPPQGIQEIFPVPGNEAYDYNLYPDINIKATSSIEEYQTATIKYGSQSMDISNMTTLNGNPQFIQVSDAILGVTTGFKDLIDKISQESNSFTVEFTGVKAGGVLITENEVYSSNPNVSVNEGTIAITYKVVPAPKYLEAESSWPSTFYALWPQGSKNAVATLKFDQEIAKVNEVKVYIYNIVPGQDTGEKEVPTYTLEPTIDGNTVTLDFSGVTRTGTSKVASIWVSGVANDDGVLTGFGDYGNTLVVQIPFENATYEEPDTPLPPVMMEEGAVNLTPSLSVSDINKTVELSWDNMTVSFADEETAEVEVIFNGLSIGTLNSNFMVLVPAEENQPAAGDDSEGDMGGLDDGEENPLQKGAILQLLLSAADLDRGVGTYEFNIPEGLVVAEKDGALNPAQTVTVIVNQLVDGSVTPEDGFQYSLGDGVIITISFAGEEFSVVEDGEDDPILVTNYDAYDETYTWNDTEIVTVDPENLKIIINLGSELAAGTYYVTLQEGAVLVDGVENNMLEYTFTILGEETDAINSLNSEKEVTTVYNLQGVKVANSLEGLKGLYIVNGKKVLVK